MLRPAAPPPDPDTLTINRVMVASEGRPFTHDVLVRAMELARPQHARLFVMTVARVWGTGLGFPNPGLQPTRHEWDEQRLNARRAVETLEKAGFDVTAMVLSTRRPRKRFLQEAKARKIDVIVMGADPDKGLLGDFAWSQEPQRTARRSRIPVYLVPVAKRP
ncbi:MAG: universal stress protein [Gaiellales bacterium]|jgi:nucleotide-binding universal stress UspA family protein